MTEGDVRSKRPFWIGGAPLILASQSEARRALLAAAGFDAEILPAKIDERALEQQFFADGGLPEDLAPTLAEAKALAISLLRPEAFCLGADQTLTLGNTVMHKPRDFDEAAQTLAMLSGRTHRLISAFCIARSGTALVLDADYAELHMRTLDRRTIAGYLDLAGPSVLSSVGAYQIEGLGVNLFERVEGDFATILGMPMFKLLAWMRRQGLIAL
jgi:septum formation protein